MDQCFAACGNGVWLSREAVSDCAGNTVIERGLNSRPLDAGLPQGLCSGICHSARSKTRGRKRLAWFGLSPYSPGLTPPLPNTALIARRITPLTRIEAVSWGISAHGTFVMTDFDLQPRWRNAVGLEINPASCYQITTFPKQLQTEIVFYINLEFFLWYKFHLFLNLITNNNNNIKATGLKVSLESETILIKQCIYHWGRQHWIRERIYYLLIFNHETAFWSGPKL